MNEENRKPKRERMRTALGSKYPLEIRLENLVAMTMNRNGWAPAPVKLFDEPLTFYFTKGEPMRVLFDIEWCECIAHGVEGVNRGMNTPEELFLEHVAGRRFINKEVQINMLAIQLGEALEREQREQEGG